jgi:amino acid efflux transporter
MSTSPARSLPLSVPRASALYIGALFGPGLLLLPGLAAQQAGPASIIAWVALLGLSAIFATVFAALGRKVPGAAGAAGYAAAGLGRRAAAMTRWWFLAGVIAGAPIVCLIGASYVTALAGAGIGQSPLVRAAVAAGLLLAVLGLALGGVRASTMAQLLLVVLLIAVVVTAVAGSAPASRPANWIPFAPHGWLSVGRAAATLMLSFVGWEAVAPLTGRLRAGQLSRVIGIAFTVTAVLYLGLAVATISCLGRGADLSVPLADLLQLAIGPAGRAVAAAAALILTVGAVNAYISGASEMLRDLTAVPSQKGPNDPGRPPRLSAHALLGIIALAGLLLIGLSALRLADIIALVSVPTAMFLCVYLSCTASAVRILAGPARAAAAVAVLAVLAVLAFCGWPALLAVAVVAAIAALATPSARRLADSADSSRSSLARCTGATRSNSSTPLPVSWTSDPRALAGSGSRVTIPLFSSRSSRTDTVPEVRPSASISRACGIRYGGPPRRRLTMTRKSAEVRPNLANTPASSASR